MKKIWFIRHGESKANAGLITSDPGAIELTPWGMEQAEIAAVDIASQPDLIVMTPYLRTQQTAEPTKRKFPLSPVEIWPLHEFDYLCSDRCKNTTLENRKPWAEAYWKRCDAHYKDGMVTESFSEFMQRIADQLQLLAVRDEKFIVVFAHGHVIRAIMQHLFARCQEDSMVHFRDYMLPIHIPNATIVKCVHDGDEWRIPTGNLKTILTGR